MPQSLINRLYDCLLSKSYLHRLYKYLSEKTPDDTIRQLLRKYAEDEKNCFHTLSSVYEELSKTPFPLSNTAEINLYDLHDSLLKCVIHELNDLDSYKMLYAKMQETNLGNIFYQVLLCNLRHSYGLLVLITPDNLKN